MKVGFWERGPLLFFPPRRAPEGRGRGGAVRPFPAPKQRWRLHVLGRWAGVQGGLASEIKTWCLEINKNGARLPEENLTGTSAIPLFPARSRPAAPSPAVLSPAVLPPHSCHRPHGLPCGGGSGCGGLPRPGVRSHAAHGRAPPRAACQGQASSHLRPLCPTFQTFGWNPGLRNRWCWIPASAKHPGPAAFLDITSLLSAAVHHRFVSACVQRRNTVLTTLMLRSLSQQEVQI